MSALRRIPGLLDDLRRARVGGKTAAASQAEVDAGTETGKFVAPSTLAGMTGNLTAPDFTSSEQTVTVDTLLTVAHGLGAIPSFVSIVLRCKTADIGYSVGDEVYSEFTENSVGDRGVTIAADATNIAIVQASQLVLVNKTTFNSAAITTTSWKWVVRAWK